MDFKMVFPHQLLANYFPIIVFLATAILLSIIVVGIPFLFAAKKPDAAKLSPYECGFEAFDDARSVFDIRFYLVAILFIIFDLEIAFLLPWAITLKKTGMFGFYSMLLFLSVLSAGFIYEWKKGALDWE